MVLDFIMVSIGLKWLVMAGDGFNHLIMASNAEWLILVGNGW